MHIHGKIVDISIRFITVQLTHIVLSENVNGTVIECKCVLSATSIACVAFFFACFKFFLRKFFFRLELVSVRSTHRRCVFACIEEKIHRHVGLPCDFFIDALIFSAFTFFDFAQRVALT